MLRLKSFVTPAGFVLVLSLVLFAGGLYAYESLAYAQRRGLPRSEAFFTVVVLPDTQVYTDKYPKIFDTQTAWIARHHQDKNIIFVTHVGDVVEHAASTPEWQRASKAMSQLDGVVPYGVAPGNHDLEADGKAPMFASHFPLSRLRKYPGVAEEFNSKNNYRLLSASGIDMIAFNLEFCPPDDVLEWTGRILDRYPDRQAIITTHSLVNAKGAHQSDDECREFHSAGKNGGVSMWEKLVHEQHHDNLLLFLNGHDIWTKTGAARRTDIVRGRPIHQLLSDYQHLGDGGDGYLRLLTFMPAQKLIKVETYSPYLNSYLVDHSNDFVLSFP